MSKLVIVESPAKAKNIKGYLGKGYDVVASMGHVRDLPAARLSVDIAHDFAPKYAVIAGKENFVKDLKKKAQAADYVYLATDPDREGEAISWHLATLLGLDMNEKNRVTFNEITKHGVLTGMEHPRAIDIDFVNAQQARRILDRLIGYKLSPFISQKIRRGTGKRRSVLLSRRNTGPLTLSLPTPRSARVLPPPWPARWMIRQRSRSLPRRRAIRFSPIWRAPSTLCSR